MKKWQTYALSAALALGLAVAGSALRAAAPAQAAVPTGTATYLVDGEERLFSLDPIQRQGGLLIPAEVLTRLGVQVDGPDARRQVTLSRQGLAITVRLGSTAAHTAAGPVTLGTAPFRQGGYLYVPLELADGLGYAHRSEGAAVVELRDLLAPSPAAPAGVDDALYAQLEQRLTQAVTYRLGSVYAVADLIRVTPELAASAGWTADGALRAQALDLLDQYTVIEVRLRNDDSRVAVQFNPGSLYLVDDEGRQYDPTGQVVSVTGDLAGRLVPRAEKSGLVLFPRLSPDAGGFRVYHADDGTMSGRFGL